jgi:endonuclease/exonuclease/phosphatase family metal-dependent hydrolase
MVKPSLAGTTRRADRHTSTAETNPTSTTSGRSLRLLTYNIQAGIATERYRHYVTRSWRHLLPDNRRLDNLHSIARQLGGYDLVALQEADAGSFRSEFTNQVALLAEQGGFAYWYQQVNRNLGKVAQVSNGLLSRFQARTSLDHKLPGLIPGRGALVVRYGNDAHPLLVVVMHLSLRRRARSFQFDYIRGLIAGYEHVIVMGDFNCSYARLHREIPLIDSNLRAASPGLHTYPSWRPRRSIDHILVSPSLEVRQAQVFEHSQSDHLPVATEIIVPREVELGIPG